MYKAQGLSPLPEFYVDPEIGMKDGLPYLEYLDDDSSEGVTSQMKGIVAVGNMRALRVKIKYPEKPELSGYDMYLTTGRPSSSHFGDGTHWLWNLNEQMPDQYCMIHPEKARALGIKEEHKMSQYAIMVDTERCIGCKSCETACKQENGVSEGRYRLKVLWINPKGDKMLQFVAMPCMHCEKPACAASCPTKAISKRKEDGIVLIDKSKCIGCRYCVYACPYGAVNFDSDKQVADKCTYCVHRLERNEKPACVSKCPGYALTFGLRDELSAKAKTEGRRFINIDKFKINPSTLYVERLKS